MVQRILPLNWHEKAKQRLLNAKGRKGDEDCWIWPGSVNSQGYGQFFLNNVNYSAHRASYEVFTGPIPEGIKIRHTCDRVRCFNPKHLIAGTQKENIQDSVKRKRRHGQILIWEDVDVIREEISKGARTGDLAVRYGVSPQTISSIKSNDKWKK